MVYRVEIPSRLFCSVNPGLLVIVPRLPMTREELLSRRMLFAKFRFFRHSPALLFSLTPRARTLLQGLPDRD
jgi:hypothetical protein